MKTLSAPTLAHLASETTTYAFFWKITRLDAVVMGFTSHVEDITLTDAVSYKAASGVLPTNLQQSTGKGVDNLQILGVISGFQISEIDLLAGRYDNARVEIFLQNYLDTSHTPIVLTKGFIGEVKLGRKQFEAEVRSLTQRAQQMIGVTCSPLCRILDLGNARCGVNLASFTHTGTVRSFSQAGLAEFLTVSAAITGKADGYFAYGKVTFTTGDCAGITMDVRYNDGGVITLADLLPYNLNAGNAFTMIAGCDRRPETCRTVFSNMVNFDGEPFTPGADAVLRKVSE